MIASRPALGQVSKRGNLLRTVLLEASASPASASFLIPLVFSAVVTLSAFAFPDTYVYGISLHWADLVAAMTAYVTFAMARIVDPSQKGSTYRGLALWIVTGVLATIVPQVVITVAVGKISIDFLLTSLSGLVAYPIIVTVIGGVITSGVSARRRIRELNKRTRQLTQMRSTLVEDISKTQGLLRADIHSRLSAALDGITSETSWGDQAAAAQTAESLRDTIDTVIRPLSHDLGQAGPRALTDTAFQGHSYSHSHSHSHVEIEKGSTANVVSQLKVPLPDLLSPGATVLLGFVFIIPAMLSLYGEAGALRSAISLFVIWVALHVLRRTFAAVQLSLATAATALGLGSALAAFVISSTVWGLVGITDGPVAIAICIGLVTLAAAVFLFMTVRRLKLIDETALINEAIEVVVSRMKQEMWVTRKQLAHLVHGQVQSTLLAAAMRLKKTVNPSPKDFDQVRFDITFALNSVMTGTQDEDESFAAQFTRLKETWEGVCEITVSDAGGVTELLDADQLARTCVAEVLAEAVANAAKHSQAAAVSASLSQDSFGYIAVTITTTGELSTLEPERAGYGSRLLDELTTAWSRTGANNLVTLKALIALDNVRA